MSTALYRKYRSRSLDEIVGQTHITSLLQRAIKRGVVSHAYLLTGPRGVGKTSIARILAHEINQLPYQDEATHLDIIEIDAASNNGVEDVRDLREKVHIAPTSAEKKVYIIDEVHMLSKPAFNALLKTLEEPPAHVVFILATTDYDKLPDTIISRVQQFHFRTVPVAEVAAHLRTLADAEKIAIEDAALTLVAQHGEGSFRDSISLLDQLRTSSPNDETITTHHVAAALGASSEEYLTDLLHAYRSNDLPRIVSALHAIEHQGAQPAIVARQLLWLLQKTLAQHPEDIDVLGALTAVHASHYPYIALLQALCTHVHRPSGSTPPPATTTPAPAPPVATAPNKKTFADAAPATPKKKTPAATAPASSDKQASATTAAPKKTTRKKKAVDASAFDWSAFVEYVRSTSVGAATILGTSSHAIEDGNLLIYTGKPFSAKKLENAKNLPLLHAALGQQNLGDLPLEIRGESAPPSDEDAAAVAAIMGGGEEIQV